MTKTIVSNEKVFTHTLSSKKGVSLTLKKQSYSDGTCFYSLQDRMGNFKVEHADSDLNKLIDQIQHEVNVYREAMNGEFVKNNPDIKTNYKSALNWKLSILNDLKSLNNGIIKEVI